MMVLRIDVDFLLMDCVLSSPYDSDFISGFEYRRELGLSSVYAEARSAVCCIHVNTGCLVPQRDTRRKLLQLVLESRAVRRRRHAAAADILLTPPPPIITDRRAAAAAADRMSASRRRCFREVFTSRCAPSICC